MVRDSRIRLANHRDIAYTDIGEPDWDCVMFFHGAPSSRLRLAYLEEEFIAKKVRVVSPDRPGYGGSTPQSGRGLNDWPLDVTALADSLGIEHYIVAGHSSGGPYAVACAALNPGRVRAAIVLAGVTDMGWSAAWDGYLESEARLMRFPTENEVIAECEAQFGANGSGFFAASGITLAAPDESLYSDAAIARLLAASRVEAFRQGVIGYAQDVFIQGRPWQCNPHEIMVPVAVVHGALDTLLPVAHSRHTADLIPISTLRIAPDHGHFSILGELPDVASNLFMASRRSRPGT